MRRMTPKRFIRLALAILLLPLMAAAFCYGKWITFDNRLITVTPGAVYQSAAFAPVDLVAICNDYGIKTIIDLRHELPDAVLEAAGAAAKAGIAHVHLPTISHPMLGEAHAFLDALAKAERPVLVHCQHGEGRSVMMCAVHRIENEGWSNAQAFDGTARLPDGLRFLNRLFPNLRRFRAEHTKGQFVLDYVPRQLATEDRMPQRGGIAPGIAPGNEPGGALRTTDGAAVGTTTR
ncbi:MAG: protein tyrosine phosphatase (PTP) superfamily phosphohydrolase (DUF442 family) [Neolewinella sp.]|jgi:protein tyrosine phosphatase (PTP) superfamily phosphohydrolase (DUF442 family)